MSSYYFCANCREKTHRRDAKKVVRKRLPAYEELNFWGEKEGRDEPQDYDAFTCPLCDYVTNHFVDDNKPVVGVGFGGGSDRARHGR